ncbi:MAG: xanthine dehydrogenase family protein molybdopterin-binding subunit, partial [Bauldia litoralis]
MKFGVGQPVARHEDPKFLTGRGRYVDDIKLPGQVWGHVLRSPHAAAKILSIDTGAAKAADGVLLVLTGADLDAAGVGTIPCPVVPMAMGGAPPKFWPRQPALAGERVRHIGEPVAFVVAATRAQAENAAELIEVDYDELTPIVSTADADNEGAALVWDEAPGNLCFTIDRGDKAAADA